MGRNKSIGNFCVKSAKGPIRDLVTLDKASMKGKAAF